MSVNAPTPKISGGFLLGISVLSLMVSSGASARVVKPGYAVAAEDYTNELEHRLYFIKSFCMTDDETIDVGRTVFDKHMKKNISCGDLSRDTAPYITQKPPADLRPNSTDCSHCRSAEVKLPVSPPAELSEIIAHVPACSPKEEIPISSCMGDFAKNLVLGPIGSVLVGGAKGGKSSCLTELVTGLVQSVMASIEGLWDLAKVGAQAVGDLGHSIGRWLHLTKPLNKSAQSAQLLSKTSKSGVDEFKAHPIDFVKKLWNGLWKMMAELIRTNYGCEDWEGVPHLPGSKCVKPGQAFDCASCDSKINSICGVIGFVGGSFIQVETILGYLGGEAAALTKFGVNTARLAEVDKFGAIGKVAGRMAKATKTVSKPTLTALKRASLVLRDGRQEVSAFVKVVSKAALSKWEKLTQIPAAQAVLKLAQTKAGKVAVKVIDAPVKLTIKTTKLGVKFLTASIDSFKGGFAKGFAKGSTRLEKGMRLPGSVASHLAPKPLEVVSVSVESVDEAIEKGKSIYVIGDPQDAPQVEKNLSDSGTPFKKKVMEEGSEYGVIEGASGPCH